MEREARPRFDLGSVLPEFPGAALALEFRSETCGDDGHCGRKDRVKARVRNRLPRQVRLRRGKTKTAERYVRWG